MADGDHLVAGADAQRRAAPGAAPSVQFDTAHGVRRADERRRTRARTPRPRDPASPSREQDHPRGRLGLGFAQMGPDDGDTDAAMRTPFYRRAVPGGATI